MSALWLYMCLPPDCSRLSSMAGVLVGFAPLYMGRGPSYHFDYVTDHSIDMTDQKSS